MSFILEEHADDKPLILIIDPRPENISSLIDVFQEANISSVTASDGAEVLKIIKNRKPDLILLDVTTDSNGFQLCQDLKDEPELKNIPIIFLSTGSSSKDIVKGFRAGASDFITKPYAPEELLVRLQNHIKNKLHLDKLELINKTKNKFLSLIAHDLRNPFTILLNFSEILYQNFDEFTDEKKKDYIKYILDSSQQSYNLLENLLRWARSQSGLMEFYPVKIDVTEIIKENILFTAGYAQNKNLNVKLKQDSNIYVRADRNMLATVIRNLLINAIKYTQQHGDIFIDTQIQNSFAEISFADTGVGIEKERLELMFRIDKKVKTEGTNHEGGTGLGLIICREFIEKQGGKIWVQSKIGEGSRFTFSIPLAK